MKKIAINFLIPVLGAIGLSHCQLDALRLGGHWGGPLPQNDQLADEVKIQNGGSLVTELKCQGLLSSQFYVQCDCRKKGDLLHLCSWAGIRSSELAGPFSEKYENCVRFLYTWGFLVKKRDVPCPFSANSTQMSVNLGRKMSLRKLGWLDTFDREAMAAFTLWESFILLHNTLSICHTAVCLTENIRKKKQRGVQSETQ